MALGALAAPLNAATISLTPTDDARLLAIGAPDGNWNDTILSLHHTGTSTNQATAVKFDLSASPVGEVASGDATFTMYTHGGTLVGPTTISLIDTTWTEDVVTWNNLGTFSALPGATNPTAGAYVDGAAVSWTIPQATIQGWIDNGATNFGIRLYAGVGTDLVFRTSENATAGLRPSLTYNTVAVPEPSTTALLGLGGLALIMRRRK